MNAEAHNRAVALRNPVFGAWHLDLLETEGSTFTRGQRDEFVALWKALGDARFRFQLAAHRVERKETRPARYNRKPGAAERAVAMLERCRVELAARRETMIAAARALRSAAGPLTKRQLQRLLRPLARMADRLSEEKRDQFLAIVADLRSWLERDIAITNMPIDEALDRRARLNQLESMFRLEDTSKRVN